MSIAGHVGGARRHRLRCGASGGHAAPPSFVQLRVRLARRLRTLRLHALRQPDARLGGRGDLRTGGRYGRRDHVFGDGGGGRRHATALGGRPAGGSARLLRRVPPPVHRRRAARGLPGPLRRPDRSGRAGPSPPTASAHDLDGNAQQSADAHRRHRSLGASGAADRRALRGGQHLLVARQPATARTRRRLGRPFDDEVPERPQRRGRRHGGGCRSGRPGRGGVVDERARRIRRALRFLPDAARHPHVARPKPRARGKTR